MNPEKNFFPKVEVTASEKEIHFAKAAEELFALKEGAYFEYKLAEPKWEFLMYLSRNHPVLFHGTNIDVEALEPRQGMCTSKAFGRLNAVYATTDPIIPVFHSILNREEISGEFVTETDERGEVDKRFGHNYTFQISRSIANVGEKAFANGSLYILSRDGFEQGTDDEGRLIDEWVNQSSVRPLAKLRLNKEDFPFLSEVKILEDQFPNK